MSTRERVPLVDGWSSFSCFLCRFLKKKLNKMKKNENMKMKKTKMEKMKRKKRFQEKLGRKKKWEWSGVEPL